MNEIKVISVNILSSIRKIYWFVFRPKTRGAKCIVEHDGKILLVKLSYAHKGWTIPGGGVDRGETYEEAVRREVLEEVGIKLNGLKKIDEYLSTKYYKRDTVQVFYAKTNSSKVKLDGVEIDDYLWFDPKDSLPNPHSIRLPGLIEKFKSFKNYSNII